MKNMMLNGPYSHDLMITVLRELYPELHAGRDYMVAHMVDVQTDLPISDPFFTYWRAKGIRPPNAAAIKREFIAHETTYRAIFARRYRDACLEWSDAKVLTPDDLPATAQRQSSAWAIYRQALRDVPQQAGFPLDIDWPDIPG